MRASLIEKKEKSLKPTGINFYFAIMAAKGPTAGVAAKRKPSSTKNDGAAKAKKARLETPRKSRTYEEEEMESTGYDGISANSSDSEDVGAKLEPAVRTKGTNRKLASDKSDHGEANSKIFERGPSMPTPS